MIIKGAIVGSLEILIGPFEEILRVLLEIVMMEVSSALSVKLLMDGFLSNKIS